MLWAKIGIVLMLSASIINGFVNSVVCEDKGRRAKLLILTIIMLAIDVILIYCSGMFSTGT